VIPVGSLGLLLFVDYLSNLELVKFQSSFLSDIFTFKLEFFILNELFFFFSSSFELFLTGDFLGLSDELDLVLSLDNLTPVDQSLSEFFKILRGFLEVLFV